MDDFKENVIEFVKDSKQATVSFTQGRYITRIKELAEKRPDECQITDINKDGSIVAHIPTTWIKIYPNREVSEELKEIYRNNLKKAMQESNADAPLDGYELTEIGDELP